MRFERAQESLKAAELCLREGYANSAASRAYYAMFQAAQVALAIAGHARSEWSHPALQATFTTELVHRRKIYSAVFRDYLSSAYRVRQVADYGTDGTSRKLSERLCRRAARFVTAVEAEVQHAGT